MNYTSLGLLLQVQVSHPVQTLFDLILRLQSFPRHCFRRRPKICLNLKLLLLRIFCIYQDELVSLLRILDTIIGCVGLWAPDESFNALTLCKRPLFRFFLIHLEILVVIINFIFALCRVKPQHGNVTHLAVRLPIDEPCALFTKFSLRPQLRGLEDLGALLTEVVPAFKKLFAPVLSVFAPAFTASHSVGPRI